MPGRRSNNLHFALIHANWRHDSGISTNSHVGLLAGQGFQTILGRRVLSLLIWLHLLYFTKFILHNRLVLLLEVWVSRVIGVAEAVIILSLVEEINDSWLVLAYPLAIVLLHQLCTHLLSYQFTFLGWNDELLLRKIWLKVSFALTPDYSNLKPLIGMPVTLDINVIGWWVWGFVDSAPGQGNSVIQSQCLVWFLLSAWWSFPLFKLIAYWNTRLNLLVLIIAANEVVTLYVAFW